uniref:PR domain zinc finger protein 8 n=1 Tax=Chelonoidis abingdonii TaxID=106734 RepID=A0A8C0HBL1_CHEAB
MELTSLPKLLWTSDNKLLHHHFPDVFATVHTTQDIPEEASFGPCMLQNTLLDTVAFIALKCSERRNIHYVFKVDVTSVHSPAGLPWMRLVQAAANSKEQNLEAYLKNSQLYYRSTRKIGKNEELLVWYDEELSSLLGFSAIKARTLQTELRCPECQQVFKGGHSYLAHIRFLCVPEKNALPWRNLQEQKTGKSHVPEQATNFHRAADEHWPEQHFPIFLRTVAKTSRGAAANSFYHLLLFLFFLDSAATHLHILWGGRPELVRKMQPLLPHDVRLSLPHAVPSQKGLLLGRVSVQEETGGKANVSNLPRVLSGTASFIPTHDLS